MLLDLLWRPNPESIGAQLLNQVEANKTLSQIATDVQVTLLEIGQDELFFFGAAGIQLSAGAGQSTRLARVTLVRNQGTAGAMELYLLGGPVDGPNQNYCLARPLLLPVKGPFAIVARGVFSGGGVANSVTGTVLGWLLPRGNFQ